MEQSVLSMVCFFNVVEQPHLLDVRSPVVKPSDSNRKEPSSSPIRAECLHENSYNIVNYQYL